MKVIILNGPSNVGKTTTLHELYNTISPNGCNDLDAPITHPYDCRDSIYYVKYLGKKVGIVTIGDYSLETVFQIGVFLGKGADILVIANSNKEFPDTICEWHGNNYDGVIEKMVVNINSISDQSKVQEIINKF